MRKTKKEENALSEKAREQLMALSERIRSLNFLLIMSKVKRL